MEWIRPSVRKQSIELFNLFVTTNSLHGKMDLFREQARNYLIQETGRDPSLKEIREQLKLMSCNALITYLELMSFSRDITPEFLEEYYIKKGLSWMLSSQFINPYRQSFTSLTDPDRFSDSFTDRIEQLNKFKDELSESVFKWLLDEFPSLKGRFEITGDKAAKIGLFLEDFDFSKLVEDYIKYLEAIRDGVDIDITSMQYLNTYLSTVYGKSNVLEEKNRIEED